MKEFPISNGTAVVTTSYVTDERLPILEVSRDFDEGDDGGLWQFHCGNGDYSAERLRLVRLDTVLELDPTIRQIADLPVRSVATRLSVGSQWQIASS